MPKNLRARPTQDEQEARSVRQRAASRHGPADWIQHATIVVRSWEGARVETRAAERHGSVLTLRRRLSCCDTEGFEGRVIGPALGVPVVSRLPTTARSSAWCTLHRLDGW